MNNETLRNMAEKLLATGKVAYTIHEIDEESAGEMSEPLTCGNCPIAIKDPSGSSLTICPMLGRRPLAMNRWSRGTICYVNFDDATENRERKRLEAIESDLLRQKQVVLFVMQRRILTELEAKDERAH